ncbi:trypsin-like peptidase domain-containing protein [Leisingera sp. F5]|uniref:trypsin-like peptidase domain-containing protein n=1 Tax=Leisingera sp. F5 TaxID=1813816 RepID=UPI000AE92F12|nr:trypsin-like peptidase domain-containing protein [Leisingera sp. F5]
MTRLIAAFLFVIASWTGPTMAQQGSQDIVWIQIEAHPSLRDAQARAQIYSQALADVTGFSLGGNWYGILLGPYTREDAQRVLQVYRRERQIPRDSFISQSSNLRQQFWPVGENLLSSNPIAAPSSGTDTVATLQPDPEPSDETPSQARRSERDLTGDERKALQVGLQAGGYYAAAIDGSFGRGTRASMADWQAANGFEQTGILTTKQRQILMDQYNAPLISVGMSSTRDDKAGIEMQLPTKEVRFSHYEPPFAHYPASGSLGARVLMISQPGDQTTLFGLYDILQTLEIIPLEGPRERKSDSFVIEGRGNGIVSYTQAALKGGEIKGFTLIWPAGDEERRSRILTEMKTSFTRLDGVLDPAAGADAEQRIDLVSGLQVRKPRLSRSGTFVDGQGTVVTTVDAVQNCTRITLNSDFQAELVASDATTGLALVRPVERLAPMKVAQLRASSPLLQSEVAVAGFSYEGILGAPTLTYGTLSDLRGLRGEAGVTRLALAAQPGDAGGPVLDANGAVLGILASAPAGSQQLPQDVSFAANADTLRALLQQAGIAAQDSREASTLSPDAMTRLATGMTVLVSCWD